MTASIISYNAASDANGSVLLTVLYQGGGKAEVSIAASAVASVESILSTVGAASGLVASASAPEGWAVTDAPSRYLDV